MQIVSNPRNRFEKHYLEWEVEPPSAALQVFEDQTRRAIATNDSPDVGFRFSVNPYRGCTHACAYCYARPSHEYLGFGAGSDFESKIVVKLKIAEILRAELARPSWRRELIAFSGDTDCYQPLEAHYGLTRRCLEVCREAASPVGLITKSWLVTRDVDVLAALAADGLASVAFSIAFADEAVARALEPGAPRPAKRFEAMARLAAAGVPTTLMIGPIIPGLNDDQIPELLERAKQCGAESASHNLLRLPGSVEEVFLTRLREHVPLRAKRVEARLRDVRGGALSDPRFHERMRGQGAYWKAIEASFELQRRRLGLVSKRRAIQAEAAAPLPPPAARAPKPAPAAQLSLFGGE